MSNAPFIAIVLIALLSCTTLGCRKKGCTNPNATNYNSKAKTDDDSCDVPGCTEANAINYNPQATRNDGSCIIAGCTDPVAANYNPLASVDDESCQLGHTVFHAIAPHPMPLDIYRDCALKGQLTVHQVSANCDFNDGAGELTVKMAPGSYTLTVGPNQTYIDEVNFVDGYCGEYRIQ